MIGLGARFGPTALVSLVALASAAWGSAADVNVTVDPNADRRAISPLIYGVNFGSAAQANRLRWPVRRWGGNSVTRYSWEHDTHNTASDWFFFNIVDGNSTNLPSGSTADAFMSETRAAGGEVLLTVPTIGWTPKDRQKRWGYSIAKYGAQQSNECIAANNASWCTADAGNGIRTNGTAITNNDPADTSTAIDPTYVTRWMQHIASQFGTAGAGGVRFFALDNEPSLWPSTHQDVHPAKPTYDEIWTRTRDYAAAIKAQDPAAQIFGPAEWGWCAYFFSAADDCAPGADRAAHGSLDFIDWYLKQAKDYADANGGLRLIDYLDVHYYPQSNGVALSDDESAATSALRLRSLKSLYDPAYVDESWIGGAGWVGGIVKLIPRMKAWIAARYPGTKLAITEYSWGNDDGASSALAQAEALAIFGREGVDLATRWVAPADNSRVEDAFLLYLNYNGAGAKVAGDTVRATTTSVDQVGSYAIRNGNTLYLLLFNKHTAPRTVSVAVAGGLTQAATLYGFDGTNRLRGFGSATPSAGSLNLTLAARSATLAVVALGTPPPPTPTRFYTLTPCRVLDTRTGSAVALVASGERVVTVGGGPCGVPPSAKAVSANLTVTQPTAAGNLVLFPTGTPPGTSTINYAAGQTRGNNAVVSLSTAAAVSIRCNQASGSAHVILDVNGYFQ
ncbi:MAG TPA: glycoside hydrolase family 44 protein [Vicinamibacteria bacterium]